jgi:Ca2+-binding RTX toxin-like protein
VSHLLDMSPDGNFANAVLTAGRSFTDPVAGGVTITVNAISATGATITIGAPMTAAVSNGVLQVTAGSRVNDNVSIVRSVSGRYTVSNSAGPVSPGAGRTALTPKQVSCTGASSVAVNTKGGDDSVSVNGGSQAVVVKGGAGDDTLEQVGSGPAKLNGGGGNDILRGGSGKDTFIGGPGNDTVASRDGRAEPVKCKAGADRVTADPSDVLTACEARL